MAQECSVCDILFNVNKPTCSDSVRRRDFYAHPVHARFLQKLHDHLQDVLVILHFYIIYLITGRKGDLRMSSRALRKLQGTSDIVVPGLEEDNSSDDDVSPVRLQKLNKKNKRKKDTVVNPFDLVSMLTKNPD